MNQQRIRRTGALLMCLGGFGLVVIFLGWALRGRAVLAAVTLGLVVVGGALAWWKWGITEEARWRLRRAWAGVEGFQWRILFVLIAVAFAMAVIATVVGDQSWDAGIMNLATELAGAAVTYLLLQQVVGRRTTKEQLMAQMSSAVRDVAVPAVDELRREGWLTDGSLRGVDLRGADLEGASLAGADLRGADLRGVNLRGASLGYELPSMAKQHPERFRKVHLVMDTHRSEATIVPVAYGPDWEEVGLLRRADLRDTNLVGAHLEDASFHWTQLQGASLFAAHLARADLNHANLQGADLRGAGLEGAVLKGAKVEAERLGEAKSLGDATLPDGTKLSRDDWQAEFEEWRRYQQEQPEAELDGNEGDGWEDENGDFDGEDDD